MRDMAQRLAVALGLAALLCFSGAKAAPEGSPWGSNYFPHVELTAHTGDVRPFYEGFVENKIVVVNYIYTRCRDICPLQTARMAEIYRRLKDKLGDRLGQDVWLYSITMEPEVDTPALLNSYAEAYGVGPGWLFLSGDPGSVGLVRYKLGERSRNLSEHSNDLMLGNDNTGEWERSSLFSDFDLIVDRVLAMDPTYRATARDVTASFHDRNDGKPRETAFVPPGQGLFVKACATCHGIGEGDRIGPDLSGLMARREEDWVRRFMRSPDVMLARGDPIAVALDERFPQARMPNLGLSDPDIDDLLSYIEHKEEHLAEKSAEKSAESSVEGAQDDGAQDDGVSTTAQ